MERIRFQFMDDEAVAYQKGTWCRSFLMGEGQGPFTVRNVHLIKADKPSRATLAEKECDCDHLFIVLKGRCAVTARWRDDEVPLAAGQGAYFKAEEGYVIYADEEVLGLMVGTPKVSFAAGIDEQPVPFVPGQSDCHRRAR